MARNEYWLYYCPWITSNQGWLGQKIKILSEFYNIFLRTLIEHEQVTDRKKLWSCNHSRFLCVQGISCNNCFYHNFCLFVPSSTLWSNFSAVKIYGQISTLSAEFEKYMSLFCISTCPVQFSACPGSWWVQGHSLSSTSHNKLEIFSKVYSRFEFQLENCNLSSGCKRNLLSTAGAGLWSYTWLKSSSSSSFYLHPWSV